MNDRPAAKAVTTYLEAGIWHAAYNAPAHHSPFTPNSFMVAIPSCNTYH
jgi:hypothetical protein